MTFESIGEVFGDVVAGIVLGEADRPDTEIVGDNGSGFEFL